MCNKQSSRWLFFQALAQNSELRERLSKIHAESHIIEPTLLNLTAPAQVGAGMQWLHTHTPSQTPTPLILILSTSLFPSHPFLQCATGWMSCPFPLVHSWRILLCCPARPSLTLFYNDNYYKMSTCIYLLLFWVCWPHQIFCICIVCSDQVLPLSPVVVYTHASLSHGSEEDLSTCHTIIFVRKLFARIIRFSDRRESTEQLNHVPGNLSNTQCKANAPLGLSPS